MRVAVMLSITPWAAIPALDEARFDVTAGADGIAMLEYITATMRGTLDGTLGRKGVLGSQRAPSRQKKRLTQEATQREERTCERKVC